MREEWSFKTFGDIMSPARVIRCSERKLPVLSITMRNGIVEQNERFNKSIASKDRSNYKVVKNGQLVIAFPIDEGLIYTQDIVSEGIMSPAYNVWDVNYNLVDRRFLVAYFHSSYAFTYYKAKLKGTTQRRRSMDKSDLLSMPIPVPPLAEQERIVDELDLLSSIIEKKKAQLKELDQLAQSIFYDMFGDPITNEKGWKVKKLKEVCENCDSMRKPITAKDRIQGLIPYYGASGVVDYVKDYIFDGEYLLISEDGANLLARSTPIAFSIKGKTWVNNHAHVLKFANKIVQQYVEFSINLRDISSIVTGCAQPKLTQANLNKIAIAYPPLPLQQEFASKIEAIERQKSLIQQSIVETQTLFDSRMEHWFN